MIEVQNLKRFYGNVLAVDDVSFTISKREIVGLLGHNGAGKTTIMKMLTAFLEPSEGEIVIDGLNLKQDRLKAQSKIGYLPENAPLYPEMTVLQYLDYVCNLRGISSAERPARISDVVQRTALNEKAHALISTLSKGYKQRVGVAQAIIHQPEILILDEPTNGLDPAQIQEMRGLIKDLSKDATVILSTHILQEVQAVCDRVLIMSQGKLARDAKLADLQSSKRWLVQVSTDENSFKSAVNRLEGIGPIEFLGNGGAGQRFAVQLGEQGVPALAKTIVGNGWDLYSLAPEQVNLETIFSAVNGK